MLIDLIKRLDKEKSVVYRCGTAIRMLVYNVFAENDRAFKVERVKILENANPIVKNLVKGR